nr:nuclear transport factor 2 family protein [Sphingobium lignivorans]
MLPVATALAVLLGLGAPGSTQTPANTAEVRQLAHDLDQAESLRAVKRLQTAHAQFIQYRLWDDAAQLYAKDAKAIFGEETVTGRAAIRAHLTARLGDAATGPAEGALSVELAMTPVVRMAPDGNHAKGRWHVVTIWGRRGGSAEWAGGIMENEYVRQNGVWRIATLHYFPQFAGPYDRGWTNVTEDLGIVPYHYTPEQAGTPIPRGNASAAKRRSAVPDKATLARRISALNAEDDVRNLQNAYGYYVDRKMWDDVADLFENDASVEIAGVGAWDGPASIRRGLERDGPPGLREGEVNDRLQLNMIVTISPGGNEARARGLEFGMLGKNGADAYWTVATFENRYVRREGKWRIAAMRIFPQMRTDYFQGWSRSWLPEPQVGPAFAPDRTSPALGPSDIPAFHYRHPVTAAPIAYPAGSRSVANPAEGRAAAPQADALAIDPRRDLARAVSYDAVENISGALGNWIDDFQWTDMADLFTADGVRLSPAAGYYIGPERIGAMQEARYGPLRRPRGSVPMHLRVQPVIHSNADGTSARLRTRLLQFNSNHSRPGSMTAGLYEDSARIEDGTWRFSEVLIRHLWRSPGYAEGWARVPSDFGRRAAPPPDKLLRDFPPDFPLKEDGYATFPSVSPICFHYANPVSGRLPASPMSRCPEKAL